MGTKVKASLNLKREMCLAVLDRSQPPRLKEHLERSIIVLAVVHGAVERKF